MSQVIAEQVTSYLEDTSESFFALNHEGRITYLNSNAEQSFQQPRSYLLGKVFADVCGEDHLPISQQKYKLAMDTQQTVFFEEHTEINDKWYDIRAYPSPEGLLIYFRDITRQKKDDQLIRQVVLDPNLNLVASGTTPPGEQSQIS